MSFTETTLNQPPQLDMLGGSDPRSNIEIAFQMATCDASELRWLSEAHLIAYAAARQDECIKIIQRIRQIKGPAPRPCAPKFRVSRNGRLFQRRVFATGFSAW